MSALRHASPLVGLAGDLTVVVMSREEIVMGAFRAPKSLDRDKSQEIMFTSAADGVSVQLVVYHPQWHI